MSRAVVLTVTLTNASANSIALSQAVAAAGPLTLNGALVSGGVATLANPGRVQIVSAGNDSGITWTITGTARPEQGGVTQTETIRGANAGAAVSTQDYATVQSIVASAAAASTVTAGNALFASSPWVPLSTYAPDFQVGVAGVIVSGTPTFTCEYCVDDIFAALSPGGTFPTPFALTGFSAVSTNTSGKLADTTSGPARAARLTLTAAGTVRFALSQQGT